MPPIPRCASTPPESQARLGGDEGSVFPLVPFVQIAAVALCRAAGAGRAGGVGVGRSLGIGQGRDVLIERLRLGRGAAPRRRTQNLQYADIRSMAQRQHVAGLQRCRGLGARIAVDAQRALLDQASGKRAAFDQAGKEQPLIRALGHAAAREASAKGNHQDTKTQRRHEGFVSLCALVSLW